MKIYCLIILLILVTVYFLLKKKEHFRINYDYKFIKKKDILKKLHDKCIKQNILEGTKSKQTISTDFCTKSISSYLNELSDINIINDKKSIELSELPLLEKFLSDITKLKNIADNDLINFTKAKCKNIITNEAKSISYAYSEYLKNIIHNYIDIL